MDLGNYASKPKDRSCQLCDSKRIADFHHWDYEDDIGTYLCRDCHNYIHDPDGARPSETMGYSWIWPAISRLLKRHIEKCDSIPEKADFAERYNIPQDYKGVVDRAYTKSTESEELERAYKRQAKEELAHIRESL